MKKKYLGLIIVLIIIVGSLATFILYNQWPFLTGKRVILATRPVDPFDLFRGQYMTINYDLSRVTNSENFKKGDYVYVSLLKDESNIWRFNSASRSKPSSGDFIRGKVTYVSNNFVNLEYGIEQFFFERGADMPTNDITVEVALSNSGRAKLVQLFHKGEPIKIEYRKFDFRS